MQFETIILNKERNVTLSAYIHDYGEEYGENLKIRPAVIVLPGGGYWICSDKEAEPVASAFFNAGFQAYVLRYTVKDKGEWDNPLKDYEAAVDYINVNALKLQTDVKRIAVCGFSAGGHLAAYAATSAKIRPAAAILGYAPLSGDICTSLLPGVKTPAELIDDKTCPCFLFAARDDNIVDIENTVEFQRVLTKKGINFEAHIYSFGGHGFSIGTPILNDGRLSERVKNWVTDSIEWLGECWGQLTFSGYTKPQFKRTVNANFEPFLSVDCTLSYLIEQSAEVKAMLSEVDLKLKTLLQCMKLDPQKAYILISTKYRLCDLLQTLKYPEDKVDELDKILKVIPNKMKG